MLSFCIRNAIIKFMKNMIKTMNIAGMECLLYLPEEYEETTKNYSCFYVNGEIPIKDVLEELKKMGKKSDFLLLSIKPEHSVLIGYSLGGLTALYTLYKTKVFGNIGSLSGSLWYDDWIAFMESTLPVTESCKIYLSLGQKESKSRNVRMAKVAECTEHAAEILKLQFGTENIFFEWNEGGHFTDIPKRFAKAIAWFMGD